MMNKKLLFLMILMLFLVSGLASAITVDPLVGDGACRTDLGENRINSPDDCRPGAEDYLGCYFDRDECIDLKTWNEVVIGLAAIIVLLVIWIAVRDNK